MTQPEQGSHLHDLIDELRRLAEASDVITVVGDTRYWPTSAYFDVDPGDGSEPWTVTLASVAGDSIDD